MPITNIELVPLLRQIESHLAVIRAKSEAELGHASANVKNLYAKVHDDLTEETQRVVGGAYADARAVEVKVKDDAERIARFLVHGVEAAASSVAGAAKTFGAAVAEVEKL